MSQAEKQRGWVKMKQTAVSAVKISIQGPAGLDKVYLSPLLMLLETFRTLHWECYFKVSSPADVVVLLYLVFFS